MIHWSSKSSTIDSSSKSETMFDFVKGVSAGEEVVDVWCQREVFMWGTWKERTDGKREGFLYRFVIGVHLCLLQIQTWLSSQ